MFINTSDFESMPTLPDKCKGCGIQCNLYSKIAELLDMQASLGAFGEDLVGEPGAQFDAFIDSQIPDELADNVKKQTRQKVGSDIEKLDQDISETRREIDNHALACNGVLKMRASKGDVTYTASICTSPALYVRDGRAAHIPIHVEAASVKKYI